MRPPLRRGLLRPVGGRRRRRAAAAEPADARTLVNRIKALAPAAQETGAAVLIEAPGESDLASVAARGGADGVHATGDLAVLRAMRERLKGERILGAGGLRSKHDAMTAGEAGVDYVMFGEPRPDGSLPPARVVGRARRLVGGDLRDAVRGLRAEASRRSARLAGTGAEFVALGDAVWSASGRSGRGGQSRRGASDAAGDRPLMRRLHGLAFGFALLAGAAAAQTGESR